MQLVIDRRTGASFIAGVALVVGAILVYVAGASATRESDDSLAGIPPTFVITFSVAAALWIVGSVLVGYAIGRTRPSGAMTMRWSIVLFGAAVIGFVGSIVLLYSPSISFIAALLVALVSVALIVAGLVLFATSLRQQR